MSTVVETKQLSRVYETYKKPEGLLNSLKGFFNRETISKVALQPTSLTIESGKIIGLVGANGAGKTTLLKLLSGLIYPSTGEAKVLGHNPWDREEVFLKKISILLGQKNQLWWDIPASDSFSLLARIYDLNFNHAKERVQYLASILDCQKILNVQLRRLSLGERMKMEIIGSLLHSPQVLFLDEPTIGLDIVAQTKIREFLAKYVKEERPTVILTSHYMDDISRLADRLLLISQGQIVYDGTVREFTSKAEGKQKLIVTLTGPLTTNLEFEESKIASGSRVLNLELKPRDMGPALSKILAAGNIQELKVEEADFEGIIHKFMQQDIRLR